MCKYGIEQQPFSTIPDLSLDELVGDYKEAHPNAGIHYIQGYLTQQGMCIQQEQIVNSLSHVNSVAKVILQRKTIERRKYKSSRPNALWHVDRHHKPGPWGIVIHRFVDGYDRMVCWHYALTITVTLIPVRATTLNLAVLGHRDRSSATWQRTYFLCHLFLTYHSLSSTYITIFSNQLLPIHGHNFYKIHF